MQSMNISLPDPLKDFVDGQVVQGHYSSVSEYVRELIRADEKRKATQTLQALLLDGLETPDSALDSEDWQAIRREAMARLQAAEQRNKGAGSKA
ncbi:MAG: type II toxin-antitoxin system ParD family antitoxin [Burkholderiaceae bacterium]